MPNFISYQLSNIATLIEQGFIYIFPEYPSAGLFIVGLMAVLFVIYLLKSRVRQALKISGAVGGLLTFALFSLHCLMRLFHFS